VSSRRSRILHGVQLWVAMPDADRDGPRGFTHHVPPVHTAGAARIRVFIGELDGAGSPVPTFTPLLGAQVDLAPGGSIELSVDRSFEHGVLLDQGGIVVGGTTLEPGDLWYQEPGHDTLVLVNHGELPARVLLLGGVPFPEKLVLWWNFVGRSHEEIVDFRRTWEDHDGRFGAVVGYPGARLPAPPLPNTTLLARPNPATPGDP
jgi:quercetin 2,3-dioxygenase